MINNVDCFLHRITNGRWKGEVNTVAQLSRINGPLGRISERTDGADLVSLGGHHNNARISRRQRDLSVVKVGSNNNSDVDMFHKKCLTNSSSSLGLKDLSSIHVKCNGLVNLSISLQQIPPNLVRSLSHLILVGIKNVWENLLGGESHFNPNYQQYGSHP